MTTIVRSNGSQCYGKGPAPIDSLLRVLAEVPLNREFEAFGDFYQPTAQLCDQFGAHHHDGPLEGKAHFWGNFHGVSHSFDIFTDEPELIDRLHAAIAANKCRTDYRAQPKPSRTRHRYNQDCGCVSCRYEAYRQICPVCQQEQR